MRTTTKLISSVFAVLISAGSLAACSSSSSDGGASSQASSSSSVVAPVMVNGRSGAGQSYEVAMGGTVVFSTPDGTSVTDWTGTAADPSIVSFKPGSKDGSASFNPSWTPKAVGSTSVTMKDAKGDEVTFTIKVVAAR